MIQRINKEREIKSKTYLSNKGDERLKKEENLFLPIVTHTMKEEIKEIEVKTQENNSRNSPCPCCGCITIPNQGNAMAFICPV